jgi:cyclopropane-fatty-acyl-phospholipid synthase
MTLQKVFCLCLAVVLSFSTLCHAKKPAVSAKESIEGIFALADIQINGSRPWDIQVHNDQFYSLVLSSGSLGLGESYMDGWWDCPNIDQFICKVQRADLSRRVRPSWSLGWEYVKSYVFNLQNKAGSKKVIDQHYQLGNDLYKAMLDPLMVYSCGYWKNAKNLNEAEEAKFDIICKKLGFKPGMKVLDIGCGWGGFEKYAAEHYGVHVLGVTLSPNQAEHAREICKGLPVEIRVQDYRDVKGEFDRVLEIGMFEHVGHKNYRTFMEVVHRNLKPGGLFMLHTIGQNSSSILTDPWISKYIFPNSLLPSIAQIGKSTEGLFIMEDWHNFGPDYDKTLMAWYANFNNNWDTLKPVYGDRFYRMWKYYLLSCAGAFRARDIQLWQVVLSKGGVEGGYESIR